MSRPLYKEKSGPMPDTTVKKNNVKSDLLYTGKTN